MLVKFTNNLGEVVFINSDYVAYVKADAANSQVTEIIVALSDGTDAVYVRGALDEVATKLGADRQQAQVA
jgi:hypothetical protein